MLHVSGTDLGKVRIVHDIVIAVGQGQAALIGFGDLLGGVFLVLGDAKFKEAVGHAVVLKPTEQGGNSVDAL